jgi:hypothetical protein
MNPPAMPAVTMTTSTITGHFLPSAADAIAGETLSRSPGTSLVWPRGCGAAGRRGGRAAAVPSDGFLDSRLASRYSGTPHLGQAVPST